MRTQKENKIEEKNEIEKETSPINVFLKNSKTIIKIKDRATTAEIMGALKVKLQELKKIYQDEEWPVLVTGKVLKSNEIDQIQTAIEKVLKVEVTFDTPRFMGLHMIKKNFKKDIETSETKFYKSPLRSGQKAEFEGSVVILGDVNSGAEIIAEDNIVVLGNLRGMAHAGAKGNEKAIIAAHSIESPQIRIASIIKERSREEIDSQLFIYAYVGDDDQIVLE